MARDPEPTEEEQAKAEYQFILHDFWSAVSMRAYHQAAGELERIDAVRRKWIHCPWAKEDPHELLMPTALGKKLQYPKRPFVHPYERAVPQESNQAVDGPVAVGS